MTFLLIMSECHVPMIGVPRSNCAVIFFDDFLQFGAPWCWHVLESQIYLIADSMFSVIAIGAPIAIEVELTSVNQAHVVISQEFVFKIVVVCVVLFLVCLPNVLEIGLHARGGVPANRMHGFRTPHLITITSRHPREAGHAHLYSRPVPQLANSGDNTHVSAELRRLKLGLKSSLRVNFTALGGDCAE